MTHSFSKIAQHWPTAVIRAPRWWVLVTRVGYNNFHYSYVKEREGFLRVCDTVCRPLGYIVLTTWIQQKGLWWEYVKLPLMRIECVWAQLWSRTIHWLLSEEKHLCASQPKVSCYPNCSPQTVAQLVVFFILIIFPSSLTFQLPYFVILWSPSGGNFCAGYDLKELANHTAFLKLEQDVTKGPGPMVSTVWAVRVHARGGYIYFLHDLNVWFNVNLESDCSYCLMLGS